MNNQDKTGEIQYQERGMRVLVASVAMGSVVAGALSSEPQIFAASLLGFYFAITALVGSDPFYAISEKIARQLNAAQKAASPYSVHRA